MIFVTVGTHNQGFERLVKEADLLSKKTGEKFFIQRGCTEYKPVNCEYVDFLDQKNFDLMCKKASVVITHGGVGSIMTPLIMGKKVIVAPRLKEHGEHTDNHQLQITKELERQGKVVAVYNIKDLEKSIKKANELKVTGNQKESDIKKIIENFIENINKR